MTPPAWSLPPFEVPSGVDVVGLISGTQSLRSRTGEELYEWLTLLETHTQEGQATPQEQTAWAHYVLTHEPDTKARQQAYRWLEKAALAQYAPAAHLLAITHAQRACRRHQTYHRQAATYWWQQAALQNYPPACLALGTWLTTWNLKERQESPFELLRFDWAYDPLHWWRIAAQAGVMESARELGRALFDRDMHEAHKYLKLAAQAHDAEAQWLLVKLLAYHPELETATETSTTWLREAALSGHAQAQWQLSLRLSTGRLTPLNPHESVAWCVRSAQKGFAPALMTLGTYAESGYLMPVDLFKALVLYTLSERRGEVRAKSQREHLESRLSARSARRAKALLREHPEDRQLLKVLFPDVRA